MADEHHTGQCFQCDRAGFLTRYCGNFHAKVAASLGSCPPWVGALGFGTEKSARVLQLE